MTAAGPGPMPTVEEMSAQHLRQGIASRIRRLRALVDLIEVEARENLDRATTGAGTYGTVAARFDHEIAWGVANLSMASLISTASDTDIARAKGE